MPIFAAYSKFKDTLKDRYWHWEPEVSVLSGYSQCKWYTQCKHLLYYTVSSMASCPQTSNVSPKGAALKSLFDCIFFFEEVDTASLKRHPWFHHSFLQNCHLLLRIVLPATFSVICFIMSQCPLHSAWFSWSWCFLGRIVERKERVYKNNEAELCLKMFRITHLWIDCLERQLSKLAGELEEKEVKIIYAQQIYI